MNMSLYLFLGYVFLWLVLFGYLYSLGLKSNALMRKVAQFETYLNRDKN